MRRLYSEEAEQSVLGAMLKDSGCVDDVLCQITSDEFYFPQHQTILKAIAQLRQDSKPVDVFTVGERVEGEVEFSYVVDLDNNTPSSANVLTYAEVVKNRALERSLFDTAAKINALAEDTDASTSDLIQQAQILITSLASEQQADTRIELNQSLRHVIDSVERRHEGMEDKNNIRTGYPEIDKRISGFRPGDLIIVGARPGMGKTAYMLGIANHCARHYGKVQIFSMEMPHDQLTERLISATGEAEMEYIRNPQSGTQDWWGRFSAGTANLKGLPIVIDDQGGLSLPELASRSRREHRKEPVKLILIDYLQLMNSGRKSSADNRNLEISLISQGLKNLAKELKCPVVALSQLNRNLESRGDKRPINADLRDSGSLEQDADIIQFLYRDDYYNEDSSFKGVAEINTSKFRGGQPGKDFLAFNGKFTRFEAMDAAKYQSQQDAQQSKQYSYGAKS